MVVAVFLCSDVLRGAMAFQAMIRGATAFQAVIGTSVAFQATALMGRMPMTPRITGKMPVPPHLPRLQQIQILLATQENACTPVPAEIGGKLDSFDWLTEGVCPVGIAREAVRGEPEMVVVGLP